MKLTSGLSSIALVPLLNIAPCFALNQSPSGLPSQPSSSQPETIKVAGFLETVNKVTNTVERERRREERRKERRRARERARERQRARELRQQRAIERQRARELRYQRAIELRQQRAIEQQRRREANQKRFRQWWQSLSPEQKKAFIAQRRAREKAVRIFWMKLIGEVFIDSLSNPGSGTSSGEYRYRRVEGNTSAPTYTPAPVKPIHPNYGSCHHYSC